jgi:sulfate adenylyltransferase subunit 1
MELLRFFTAGNVDDGKSTLIGRLLFDSDSISTDIIETLTKQSKVKGEDTSIDLALLTDGLRAEREQGITIDVAYKYFSTQKRKFIIADTPGHAEYTRNMFTGASNANLAIILVDARHGITDQTKRHSIISSILEVPHVLVCVNKMDLVNYSETVYRQIEAEYLAFAKPLGIKTISFIPTSALAGDNVVHSSPRLDWYKGEALLPFLEQVTIEKKSNAASSRFQVQYVIRPQSKDAPDYRGYAGTVLGESFKVGDRIRVFPSGLETIITRLEKNLNDVAEVFEGEPVVIHTKDDLSISRGTSFIKINDSIQHSNELQATLCWMDNHAFQVGQKIVFQQNSFKTKAKIQEVTSKIDIHNYTKEAWDGTLNLNDFCTINLKTAEAVSYDAYAENRKTGSFILINENTNNTIAAGVIH